MKPLVSVIMGSQSDWATMHECVNILNILNIPHETEIISAHRTPDKMFQYAENLTERDIKVVIAGAGGAAHLPGMIASKTHLPVLGVPIKSKILNGNDSLLSIVQMPAGVPVATFAIGEAGAKNAAIFSASILSIHNPKINQSLCDFRAQQTQSILDNPKPE